MKLNHSELYNNNSRRFNKKTKYKKQVKVKSVETKYPELYARLKEWRYTEAEDNDLKLFMVAQNRTLQEIAKAQNFVSSTI
ncbi:MAG: HRDC domain-containing protein [Bacteroidales bacterium]|nr:HRDC domain-containing protein [Bacteroidales bacterium]